MSIYNELNNLNLDIEEFDELSHFEQKKWARRVQKKIKPKKRHNLKIITVAVLMLSVIPVSFYLSAPLVADQPHVGGTIEEFVNQVSPPDYSAYKVQIGETAENEYGKLTVNEIMLDAGRILISSTFEPAAGVEFSYREHLLGNAKLNGQDISYPSGGQSIDEPGNAFTIYSEFDVYDLPESQDFQLELEINRVLRSEVDPEIIQNPWTFTLNLPGEQMKSHVQEIQLDQTVTLYDGRKVELEKLAVGPASVLVIFDATGLEDSFRLKINSGNESVIDIKTDGVSEDSLSMIRYWFEGDIPEEFILTPYDELNEVNLGDEIIISP
ncbi:DUF4179 domain-containing protein [Jeotgalibacillus aurantiacus]|uniref:DUF4179 domain-containing protein n=1 Tax=Jeotgalibacillus aurantiacus TaxID=2763266 RepID=UPI001D0ABB55|nr:DUF4179 domain-containing protein [Jeotgalibacillus aurantiacus]